MLSVSGGERKPMTTSETPVAPRNTKEQLVRSQHFRIEAEWPFDTATALIREFIAAGFTIQAKQAGNMWTITGDLTANGALTSADEGGVS